MGAFLENIECHLCGSDHGMAVYRQDDGEIDGTCFSCKAYTKDPYGGDPAPDKPKRVQKPWKTVKWVMDNSTISDIPDRKISKEVCEKYGVRVSFDASTREITHHYYPFYKGGVIIAFQERQVADKKFTMIGEAKSLPMFGENICGSSGKLLVITEGMLDCLAVVEMFKTRGKNYRVCSLPTGASTRGIKDNFEWLASFDSIYLSLDQDEVGLEAASKICDVLPIGKPSVMHFDEKDASDMWMGDKEAAYWQAFYSASSYRPDGVVSVDDIFDAAIKPVQRGLSWPWPTLTEATYGYRRGEVYGFGAGSGSGKSEGFKEIVNHIITVHKLPVGVVFLEEPATKTLKVLAGKAANKRFHIPDGDYTKEELVNGIANLRGKVYLYDHFGSKGWESVKAKIRYMVTALGIKDIFLDHLTALVAQEDNEYKALNRIMEEMASLSEELDFTFFYISHLRKASNGTPHEEGGRVHADQFKGSGAIVYWSHFLFGYERNQQSEDEESKNTTTFRVLKDRYTGLATGLTFELYYTHATGRWEEKKDEDGDYDL